MNAASALRTLFGSFTARAGLATVALSTLLCGCQPAAVDEGSLSAARSLSSSEDVPPGDECPEGGQRVLTGIDVNGNGMLEPHEIVETSVVCSDEPPATCGTLDGSVTIHNSLEWSNLVRAGCTRITGALVIQAEGAVSLGLPSPLVEVGRIEIRDNDALVSVSFPALERVQGDFTVSANYALTRLDLPSLESVGLLDFLTNDALLRVDLPSLTTAGGLAFGGNVAMEALSAPVLATVTGSLSVSMAYSLAALDLSSLSSVGGELYFFGSPSLTDIALPSLSTVGGTLTIERMDGLAGASLPLLASAGGLSVTYDAALASLAAPALTGSTGVASIGYCYVLQSIDLSALGGATRLSVIGNPALATLDLASLGGVTQAFVVKGNPALPQCQVDAIWAGLAPPLPATYDVTGNDAAGSCL